MTTLSARITALVTNEEFLVKAANAAQKAYCEASGDPGSFKAFGVDSVDDVLNNIPALRAVVNSSIAIAAIRYEKPTEDDRLEVLKNLADLKLAPAELLTARLFANATWWTRNADRGLKRASREICLDYGDLVADESEKARGEVAKDDYLLKAMAAVLLEELNKN